MSDKEVIMSFGKHEGKSLEDVPSSYLKWFFENVEDQDELVEACYEEWQFREKFDEHFE